MTMLRGAMLAVAPLLLAACQGNASVTDTVPPAEIAQFVGHPLPPGAADVRSVRRDGLDSLILVRFQASAAEADMFARAVTGKPLQAGFDPGLGYLGASLDWWPATPPAGSAGGETRTSGNRTIKLLAIPAASTTTLYLAAFSS